MRSLPPLLILLLLALQAPPLPAQEAGAPDRVVLRGGAVIEGRLVAVDPSGVTVALQPGVPPLRVLWTQVQDPGVVTAGIRSLQLANGDRCSGRITAFEAGHLLLDSPLLGELRVPVSQLAAPGEGAPDVPAPGVVPEELGQPAPAGALEEAVEEAVEEVPATILEPKPWEGKLRLAGSYKSGNVNTFLIDFGAQARKIWARDRLSTEFRIRYGVSEDETIASQGLLGAKFDHYLTQDIYAYVSQEVSRDEVQNLDLRAVFGVGIGWTAWQHSDHERLDVEGGISALFEAFDGQGGELDPAFRAAMVYREILFEDLRFGQDVEVLTPFTDPADFLLRTRTTVSYPFSEQWSLDNTLELIYQNEPPEDTTSLDVVLTVGVQYAF